MDRKTGAIRIRRALLALAFVMLSAGSALALDARVLVMPPTTPDGGPVPELARQWRTVFQAYDMAVLQTRAIPLDSLIYTWEGDTITVALYSIDDAIQRGQQIGADRVVLTEWSHPGGQILVRALSVDPWTGDVRGPFQGATLPAALRQLEQGRWIYGTGLFSPPTGYVPPGPEDGPRAVHIYLHTHDTYPQEAVIRGYSGRAEATVIVSAKGVPIRVQVRDVDPSGWEFRKAFEQALWALKYKPAKVKGKAVNGVWKSSIQVDPVP